MSLAGKLEDVPLTDVMQFIHLGRRTGTLTVDHLDYQAKVQFHNGGIVGARSPSAEMLGELLVREGALSTEARDRALQHQREVDPGRSLGQLLLELGEVELDHVRQAIRAQIERTIFEVVTWHSGSFVFDLDTLQPIDDIAFFPSELIPDFDLNTQMVLLEAARIFDERNRDIDEAEATSTVDEGPGANFTATQERVEQASDLFDETNPRLEVQLESAPETVAQEQAEDEAIDRLGSAESLAPEPILDTVLQFVSAGTGLLKELGPRFVELEATVERIEASQAGRSRETGQIIVVFEVMEGKTSIEELSQVCSSHPGLPVICVLHDVAMTAKAYSSGAAAVVPPEATAIIGCFRSMARFRGLVAELARPQAPDKAAFDKLRRVVADLRSGVFSATVALNLMNVISESVERAVLFLVKRESLSVLGAFGFDNQGRPLAERTHGVEIQLSEESGLSKAMEMGRALKASFDEANLPDQLIETIGRPIHEEIVIFPVLGSDRVILVVYTDNGLLDRPIEEIDVLDLAAAEVGIAFENELLRRQLSERRQD